jgi:hypothetical protein
MPIHDWTRVDAGIFHHFHTYWLSHLGLALNSGLLPPDYYAMAEQIAGSVGPDVLALQTSGVRYVVENEQDLYAGKQRTLVIHHVSGDRIIALIEILSPGNKASRHGLRSFLDKAAGAVRAGYHLLLVDLFPPGRRDPQGIHGALWAEFADEPAFALPPDKPLTLAAGSAGLTRRAYVEPVAVGDLLPDMPLFLTPDEYVEVPLEKTYSSAWEAVPRRWRDVLETPSHP